MKSELIFAGLRSFILYSNELRAQVGNDNVKVTYSSDKKEHNTEFNEDMSTKEPM